jgi:hypothetical protein
MGRSLIQTGTQHHPETLANHLFGSSLESARRARISLEEEETFGKAEAQLATSRTIILYFCIPASMV